MKSFEGSFRNLNFSSSTSILLNFFFPFMNITCFFSSLRLHYCRTIVLLNKLKLFKEKRWWSCDFPPRKNALCPKAPRDFLPRKDGILHPSLGCLGTPLPLLQSLYGRASGRTYADFTTKFLGSIGYQICLAMDLRWRALLAGSAIILRGALDIKW